MLTFPVQMAMMGVMGCCIGSFLNVCIDRWPHGQSVIRPRSHCLHCRKPIPWYHNMPVVSWLQLRGKSRCCQQPIGLRSWITEGAMGVLAALIWYYTQALFVPYFIFTCLLWVTFCVDMETMTIPDEVTLLGMGFGCALSAYYPVLHRQSNGLESLLLSLQGMCWGVGGLVIFITIMEFFLKKEAMGFGDVKCLGYIGAFLGWQGCVWSLFVGSIIGCFWALIAAMVQRPKESAWDRPITFGPFLSLGAASFVVVAHAFPEWYDASLLGNGHERPMFHSQRMGLE